MRLLTAAAVVASLLTVAGPVTVAAQEAAAPVPPPAAIAKRVRPPQAGKKKLIDIQIDPAEQARFIASLPPFPKANGARTSANGRAPGKSPTAYPWFWEKVSPSMANASGGRLFEAVRALTDGPGGATVATPRMQSMQDMADTYGSEILRATIGTKVSPALVLAVMGIESAGRAAAVSPKGATGLMQLMPATARRFGVSDIKLPAENIRGGVAYLDWLMNEFGGDPLMVLAAYNAGEGAVQKYGGVPPYRETRDYVPKVLAAWTVARGLCSTPPEMISDGCVFRVRAAGL